MRQRKGEAGQAPAAAAGGDKSAAVAASPTAASSPASPSPSPRGWWVPDAIILAVLAVLAAVSRFWRIHDPRGIIFDEAHFNKFSTWYISQHYYVDIHPPLAKLAFAAMLWLVGFKGAQEDAPRWWVSEKEGGFIGTKDWLLLYEPEYGEPYLPLRRLSATMGVAFVLVAFLTGRAAGFGRIASVFLAWLAGCELVILLQSRAILCDIFLYFFNMATIGATFASARPRLSERVRVSWCLLTGLLLGCAMSVKLTALGTVAVVGVHQGLTLLAEAVAPGAPPAGTVVGRGVARAAAILAPAAAVFVWLWVVHLDILIYSGQGDNFMIPEFSRMLKTKPPHSLLAAAAAAAQRDTGPPDTACPNFHNQWADCGWAGMSEQDCTNRGCCWDPASPKAWCYRLGPQPKAAMALWPKLVETLRATWANNNGGAVMIHPHMSEWYEWPTMNARIVPFAASSEGGQLKTVGNPAVWWGAFGNFVAVTAVGALWMGRALLGLGAKPAAAAAAPAPAAPAVEPLLAPLLAPSALDARGWAIPWVVLWSGYLLNLVPYMLIARSKFVYHYMPALMVGAALFALSMEALWGWAARAAAPAPRVRAAAAAAVTAAAFAAVTAAFFYFGLPFVYGYKLTHEQHQARMWNSKWQ